MSNAIEAFQKGEDWEIIIGFRNMEVTGDFDKSNFSSLMDTKTWFALPKNLKYLK